MLIKKDNLDQKIEEIFKGGDCITKATLKRRIRKLVKETIEHTLKISIFNYNSIIYTMKAKSFKTIDGNNWKLTHEI